MVLWKLLDTPKSCFGKEEVVCMTKLFCLHNLTLRLLGSGSAAQEPLQKFDVELYQLALGTCLAGKVANCTMQTPIWAFALTCPIIVKENLFHLVHP